MYAPLPHTCNKNKGAVSLRNSFDETVMDNFIILTFCVMKWEVIL